MLAILGGGALLAAVLVGGPALLFSLNAEPPQPAPTSRPVQAPSVQQRVVAATVNKTQPMAQPVPETLPVDPIRRGWQLYVAGDITGAKASFEPLTGGERINSQALHGWALCVYKLDRDHRPALAAIDQAAALSPRDEAIIYNAAVMHLADSPMQSVRLLHDFLDDPERSLNEPMQNLLGLALSRCDAKTQATPDWKSAQAFYGDYDKRLESGRLQRRWGEQWLDPSEAEAKWTALHDATTAVDNAARAQRDASDEASRQSFQVLDAMGDSPNSHETEQATARFQKARQAEAAAKEKLKQAQAALDQAEKPPFTQRVETVVPKSMR